MYYSGIDTMLSLTPLTVAQIITWNERKSGQTCLENSKSCLAIRSLRCSRLSLIEKKKINLYLDNYIKAAFIFLQLPLDRLYVTNGNSTDPTSFPINEKLSCSSHESKFVQTCYC